MGMTLAEKLLAGASGRESVTAGEIVTAKVDVCMMDDSLGPRFIEKEFDRLGRRIWDRNGVVLIADHQTPSCVLEQAEIVALTRRWAGREGVRYFEGCGPCHQILAENCCDLPGTVLVGTDSHTVTAGAFGCFGTGIGSTEAVGVMASGSIWFRVPESIKVLWNGKMQPGVMAKDLFLRTLRDVGHAGATYKAMEFSGDTISAMSMDGRMCVSNMSVEAGAKVGLIAADSETDRYLSAHGCRKPYVKLHPDADAVYEKEYRYDASELVPQVSCPHAVDNVKDLSDVAGVPIQQAYLGSCTGGRMEDLTAAAHVLKGRKIAAGCRMLISPASKQVLKEALAAGIIEIFIDAGATLLPPTCGACAGLHNGLLAAGENCVSATNRNFKGRMGSYESNIYLASPAAVAAAAVTGALTDPREFF